MATPTSPTTTPTRTASAGPRLDVRWSVRHRAPLELAPHERRREVDREQDDRTDVPGDLEQARRERERGQVGRDLLVPVGQHLRAHLGLQDRVRRIDEEGAVGRRGQAAVLGQVQEQQDDRHEPDEDPQVPPATEAHPVGGEQVPHAVRLAGGAGDPQVDGLERIPAPDQLVGEDAGAGEHAADRRPVGRPLDPELAGVARSRDLEAGGPQRPAGSRGVPGGEADLDPLAASRERVRRPGRDDPPVIDDRDLVAGLLDLGELVARHEDGATAAGEGQEQVPDLDDAGRIEAVGRLVQDQRRRVGEEREGDAQALAHPGRVALRRPAPGGAEVHEVERLRDPRIGARPRPSPGGRRDPQVLDPREVRVEDGRRHHRADALAGDPGAADRVRRRS